MIRNLFSLIFDTDFLAYPEVLRSRHQFNELMKQEQMVKTFFKQLVMRDPGKQISNFGFNSLWVLSKTEMINIFEYMGRSMAYKVDSAKEGDDEKKLQSQWNQVLSIIFNNIAISIIDESPNDKLRDKFYAELNQKPSMKIGFAWKEPGLTFPGSNVCSEGTFVTQAKVTVDSGFWLIDGQKEGIIIDPTQPDPDYYLVFARTDDFPQSSRPAYLIQQVVPFPGIVTLLIPKTCILNHEDYEENGLVQRRISFKDILIALPACDVLPAEVDGVNAVNYKSLAGLGLTSLILGQMKSLMEETHDFILCKKSARMGSEALDFVLSQMTQDLYITESCVYYCAAMFDQLLKGGNPEIHLETTLTTLIAQECALNFVAKVRTIFGVEKHDKFGQIINNINRLSTFLDERNFNKAKVSLDGLEFLMEGKGKFMNSFCISPRLIEDNMLRRLPHLYSRAKRAFITADKFKGMWDLQGYLHNQLEDEAPELERLLRIINYAGEVFVTANEGKVDPSCHHDLMMIYDIVKDVFICMVTLARSSRSISETLRNAEVDLHMAKLIMSEKKKKIKEDMNHLDFVVTGRMSKVFKINQDESFRLNGYYPQHPLDGFTKDTRNLKNFYLDKNQLI